MMYDVYSEFNIDKHAETFINYLEVCISPEGKIFYAVPSHQMFLENVLKKMIGKKQFEKEIESEFAYYDYMTFLCTKTKYISVWNTFYMKGLDEITNKQKEVLTKLSKKHYKLIDNPLYGGQI